MAGSKTKRGKNTWRIRVALEPDANGKRRNYNATVYGSSKDADDAILNKLKERNQGILIQASTKSLDQFLDEWLAESAKPRLAESTYWNYEYLLKLYVRDVLGSRRLSSIKTRDIQKLYNGLTAAGRSARTVRYVHAILASAFSSAIKWHMLAVNPCSHADLPKKAHTEMKAFSRAEAKRFLEACKTDKLGTMFAFALVTGMRPEEYLGLKWSDLDFEKCTATVQRTLVRRKSKGGGWYFGEPKTAKSRRTVPIGKKIIPELRSLRSAQLELMMKLGTEYERNDLVFATDLGKPLDLKNIRNRNFARILKAADLEGFRVYDLRHSMATLMLAEGVNPKMVSERLGHANIALTMDTYSHVLPDMQQEATARLDNVLYG